MKIICQKSELVRGIQTVQNVISSKTTLPVLSHILMKAENNKLQLCATDLEVGIRSSVEAEVVQEGAVTMPGRTIGDIVKEAPEEKIEILADEKSKVTISCGKSLFRIMGLPKEEFPKLPESGKGKGFDISKKTMKELIKKTSFAISREEARYALNGILFEVGKEEITAVSTDGRRLAKVKKAIAGTKTEKQVILPSKAVNEVNRIIEDVEGEVRMAIGENEVTFEMDGIMLMARLVKGDFPDYDKVVPKTYSDRITLDREKFLSGIRRVSLLTSEKSNTIKISLSRDRMVLSASTPELGEASEEMDISYEGEEEILAFNPVYLMDFLRNEACKEIYFEIINPVSPAVLRPVEEENYFYVVMPIKT